MMRAAVLGSPVSHSLSPLLHTTAYQSLGIDASYVAIEVNEESFDSFIADSFRQDWSGFSLTMPLKSSLLNSKTERHYELVVEETALRIRSINTIKRDGSKLTACSTDFSAFQRLLKVLPGERVAIIGGGGTARAAFGAVCGELSRCDFLLRSDERLKSLKTIAPDVDLENVGMSVDLGNYDLVINTSPVGAADHLSTLMTRAPARYLESLYRPSPTVTSTMAASRGAIIIDGVDLLVEQALDQIAIFSGKNFDYNLMRTQLLSVARQALLSTSE